MTSGSMRRAQLVSPFGVGAMSVLVDSTSVITAGLDHWFPRNNTDLALEDFRVNDWRLEARLNVHEFRLPPDYRKGSPGDHRNEKLSVPALRFPCYSFCVYCKRLKKVPLSFQEIVRCTEPTCVGKRRFGPKMSQVPFVAICKKGHIDDFPFRDWVHRSKNAGCNGVLRLFSTGGGGLEGQVVRCGYDARNKRDERKGCGASRPSKELRQVERRTSLARKARFSHSSWQVARIRICVPVLDRGYTTSMAHATSPFRGRSAQAATFTSRSWSPPYSFRKKSERLAVRYATY